MLSNVLKIIVIIIIISIFIYVIYRFLHNNQSTQNSDGYQVSPDEKRKQDYLAYKKFIDQRNSTTAIPEERPDSKQDIFSVDIQPEIADLLWFVNDTTEDEPSIIDLSLPVSEPFKDKLIESPPYYPSYRELSPEQKRLYWKFLSDPFTPPNDIGYVFLFYYGVERHMISSNLDKAFDITLKLRSCYNNNSFQIYTASTLILVCITRNRTDLIQKLIDSNEQNDDSFIPINYLLLLKYKFSIPLTVSEIIQNYQYFGFTNGRYIKNEPELFTKILSDLLMQNFNSNSIKLNEYFPTDMETLPTRQERMFANISLRNYKANVQVFDNTKLVKKVSSLLYETHEAVKNNLHYGNNTELNEIPYTVVSNKLKKNTFKNMSGHDFEKYCANLLSLNGFSSVSVTKDSGDQGVDIIAYKGDIKYGIQCKLYSSRVGNSAVQQVYSGKDFYKCQIGAVLTNNYFTESAQELATALGVILWDGNYLYNLQQKIS